MRDLSRQSTQQNACIVSALADPLALTMPPGERRAIHGWHSINPPRGCRGGGVPASNDGYRCISLQNRQHPPSHQEGSSRQKWCQRHESHIRPNEQMDFPTVINTNICGALASKLDEIKVKKDDFGADVLAITET